MSTNPPEPVHDRPLAQAIAAATRSVHAKLNKLIIARLPLALPPCSPDPANYISGILHIAPIYITFEALWRNILDTTPSITPEESSEDGCNLLSPLLDVDATVPSNYKSLVCERTHSTLRQLYLPGLTRSDRLRADIKAATGWSDILVEEQLRSISQTGHLGQFLQHIKQSVKKRPHVLLAYSYILFMALFAGGCFISASLETAGEDFWNIVPSPIRPQMHPCRQTESNKSELASGMAEQGVPAGDSRSRATNAMPLRFFHFPTAMDGEDLKHEFKKRMAESEARITSKEKQDIIQEAVCIFENMLSMVSQLDEVWESIGGTTEDVGVLGSSINNPLSWRLRDSLAITKDRRLRSSKQSSSSEDTPSTYIKTAMCPAMKVREIPKGHPPTLSKMHDGAKCPALTKSVRFEPANSPTPPADLATGCSGSLKMASRALNQVRATNLLVLFAFGAIILGVLVTGRRSILMEES